MAHAHLALVTDEPDTEVIDVDDPPSRALSVEVVMQVKLVDEDGPMRWHRWLAGSNGRETACGVIVDQRLQQGIRYETCEGDLCPECFTARELVKAALANTAARRRNS